MTFASKIDINLMNINNKNKVKEQNITKIVKETKIKSQNKLKS